MSLYVDNVRLDLAEDRGNGSRIETGHGNAYVVDPQRDGGEAEGSDFTLEVLFFAPGAGRGNYRHGMGVAGQTLGYTVRKVGGAVDVGRVGVGGN